MKKVSVIIPSYKPQSYLWECLKSLKAQTLPTDEFEIVLVLNGCGEPYKQQIQQWITEHDCLNVVFVHVAEGGVSNARNVGIDTCQGEYITFVDDDDYLSPSCLEEMLSLADVNTVPVCYPYAFNDGSDVQIPYRITNAFDSLENSGRTNVLIARRFFSGPCMKLLHRNMIGDRRFDKSFRIGEDSLFMFQISDKIDHVVFTSRNAIYYRRYRDSSATTSAKDRKEMLLINIKSLASYTRMYFHGHYDTKFYIVRILTELLCFIRNLK